MTTKKQTTIPGIDLPDAVIQGIHSQLRKLRMAEKRQASTLEETRQQIAALEEILG